MLDRSARLLTEYQYEIALKKEQEWFNRVSLECPECGVRTILPREDYLCAECRLSYGDNGEMGYTMPDLR
jgi:hypothetical protein